MLAQDACKTEAERMLADELRKRKISFLANPQLVCAGGKVYTPDFLFESGLIVEVMGSIHWKEKVRTRDIVRVEAIRAEGYRVIEFLNEQIFRNVSDVANLIEQELEVVSGFRTIGIPVKIPRNPGSASGVYRLGV